MTDKTPKFPYFPVVCKMAQNMWRGRAMSDPLHFVQIGKVSFYVSGNGTVVRIMYGTHPDIEEYFLDSEYIQGMFPHTKIKNKVSQNEIKFNLLRMLGTEAHAIIDPVIERRFKESEK
jgi:hypothetical protein